MATIDTAVIDRGKVSIHPSLKENAQPAKQVSFGDRLVRDLAKKGLLPFRFSLPDYDAVFLGRFLEDKEAAWGGSGALRPIDYGSAPGGSERLTQPPIPTDAMQAAERVLNRLHKREIELLAWLEDARGRKGVSLATLGYERYGLVEPRQAHNQAAGALRELAKSVAEHYPKHRMTSWSGTRFKRDRHSTEP